MKVHKLIINGLFIISIILIVWINFFEGYYIQTFIKINSIKLNRLIETVAVSYLTSFIFYYVIVIIKEKRDKKIIMPFIADYVYVAMNNCMCFCFSMRNSAGLESVSIETNIHNRNLNIYPNLEDLKTICTKINPNEEKNADIGINGLQTIPHFFGVMINYTYQIDYFLKIVLDKSNFIDIELLRILTDIQTHGYHQHMLSYDKKLVMTAKHRHDNLSVFEKSFLSYFELFRMLEDYSERYLKKYVERESLKKITSH